MNILVIDDEPSFRNMLRFLLEGRGHQVSEAPNGDEARVLARTVKPALVMCDVHLKTGDGFTVLQDFRKDPATASVPFILITGHRGDTEIRKGMEHGADDFLEKPFTPQTLFATLEAQFEKQRILREEMGRTQERLLAVLEAVPALIAMAEPESGRILYVNLPGRRLLGLNASQEVTRFSISDFHPPRAAETILQQGIPAAVRQGNWTVETTLRNQQREEIPVSEVILAHRNAEGKVDFLSLIARDIRDEKRAQEALRKSERLFRIITENGADLIAIVSPNGQRIYNSPSYTRLLGYSLEELQSTHSLEQVWPDDREKIREVGRKTLEKGTGPLVEYGMRHKDGHWVTLESRAAVIRNEQGEPENLLIMAHDVSERKQAERERNWMEVQLRHAQKMESIGQLAAGIAQEINTPTQYIGDNLRFLKESFTDLARLLDQYGRLLDAAVAGPVPAHLVREVQAAAAAADLDFRKREIPPALEHALHGVEQVAAIARAMQDFAQPGREEVRPVDLNQAIENTITMSRHEWKDVADMVKDLSPDLPPVHGLSSELNQVILNLLVNAVRAIGESARNGSAKGRIQVTSRACGDLVEIRVTDTGDGIPVAIQNRVFEPFFTTKPGVKGAGQGLAVCHSVVVEKHGGTIHFESAPDEGTTFVIRLPTQPPAGTEANQSAA